MSKLLLLEDDLSLINGLSFAFQKAGHELDIARTLREAEALWQEGKYDLLVLDVSLPDGSGFEFCKKVRQTSQVPIIFLTASDTETSIIMGLDIGGDDYIQKPYSLSVLLAKVKAVLKRCGKRADANYADGRLTVDFDARQALVNGMPVRLTALEFKLLAYLIRNEGRMIPKQELFEKVWEDRITGDGTLNVHVRRIREAIEPEPNRPRYIVTFWGEGYRFRGAETGEPGGTAGST